ncbi:DNA/RNA non-specific endonuclease [Ochrovirga pacifica]|uniref:DNA/RNA non-specific endonuclease n=1 Tax=Ochrovirga pacifica TaxID=1042376 RepID=UPI000255A023|nr:DNA/RNA non-specific endonuclease [Ochrovirga pacifica]
MLLIVVGFVFYISNQKDKAVTITPLTAQPSVVAASETVSYQFSSFLPTANQTVYHHQYYALEYNEEHEQPNWVYYLLTSAAVKGTAKRKDDFRQDPSIHSKSATLNDYKKSGYDRGHLCPAADMKQNKTAMSETFFMSNMSPQLPSFNRGEWKRLEAQVREWAVQEDSLLVVTGPIFKNNIDVIGDEKVTVPGSYYKVIYDLTPPQKMIGFVLPHVKKPKPYNTYQTSVNDIEALTGIDFFSILNDSAEEELESLRNWE